MDMCYAAERRLVAALCSMRLLGIFLEVLQLLQLPQERCWVWCTIADAWEVLAATISACQVATATATPPTGRTTSGRSMSGRFMLMHACCQCLLAGQAVLLTQISLEHS
jgi:hypothetical protein